MTRLEIAELTSGVGALVLGAGLGALFPQWFAPAASVIVLAGVVAHAFGMWEKHRLEGRIDAPLEPWVTAIALAVGVQRMAARHVLVRRLPAVETLGCATVICTDRRAR